MSGKTFLDTNIVVYLYSGDEPEKRAAALALIEQNNSVVSTQVLSELANTLSRKFRLPFDVVAQAVAEVRDACSVVPVMPETIAGAGLGSKIPLLLLRQFDIGGGIVCGLRDIRLRRYAARTGH